MHGLRALVAEKLVAEKKQGNEGGEAVLPGGAASFASACRALLFSAGSGLMGQVLARDYSVQI
jgi:hypothetical protein